MSGTVRDLIAGSEVHLVDRGHYQLKGLDGSWTLFAVERLADRRVCAATRYRAYEQSAPKCPA